jgi:undecaprenyl-diphosphatase
MYLGVHTIVDVIFSLVITFLLILLTVKVILADEVSKKRELWIALGMVLCAAIVIIVAAMRYADGAIDQEYVADCLKAAGAGIGFAAGMFIERVYLNFSVKAKSFTWQIVKFVFGFAGVIIIKEGLKPIIGTGLIADMFRYFLIIMWITAIYPLIIKRFNSKLNPA